MWFQLSFFKFFQYLAAIIAVGAPWESFTAAAGACEPSSQTGGDQRSCAQVIHETHKPNY